MFYLMAIGDMLWSENITDRDIKTMAVGDLDGDGIKNDIVIGTNSSSGKVLIKAFACDGTQLWERSFTGSSPVRPVKDIIIIKSLDGDGCEDVAFCYEASGDSTLVYIDNDGASATVLWSKTTPNGQTIERLTSIDVDSDGDPEIVYGTSNYSSGTEVFAAEPSDGSTPTGWSDYNAAGDIYVMETAIVGDAGGEKIVIGRSDGTELHVLNPDGTPLDKDSSAKGNVEDLTIADIDNDSQNEIIFVTDDTSIANVYCFELATGTLSSKWSKLPVATAGTAVCPVEDLDSDGENEVAAAFGSDLYFLDGSTGATIGSINLGANINDLEYLKDDLVVAVTDGQEAGSSEVYVVQGGATPSIVVQKDVLSTTSKSVNKVEALNRNGKGKNDAFAIGCENGAWDELQVYDYNYTPTLSFAAAPYDNGVDPDTGTSGTLFTFKIVYDDQDLEAPSFTELWLDKNNDGDYDDTGEKIPMTLETGNPYSGTYSCSVTLNHPGTAGSVANLNFKFVASDGLNQVETATNTVGVQNIAPQLSFDTAPYDDGVEPNPGYQYQTFEFRVVYTDDENHPPQQINVLIDLDNSSTYDADEAFDMEKLDPSDNDYTDGCVYKYELQITVSGTINFKFSAVDSPGDSATGTPTTDQSLTVNPNNKPVLSGDVSPSVGRTDTLFKFSLVYSDADDDPPPVVQVWIDENDNGSFEDSEKYNMNETDPSDTTYTDGKDFEYSRKISFAGDGIIAVRFYAQDNKGASEYFDTNFTVEKSGETPTLAFWEKAPSGTLPAKGLSGANFTFYVVYKDEDGDWPQEIALWIDLNDDDHYQENEKFAPSLLEGNPQDGAIYTYSSRLYDKNGDGKVKFRYTAKDINGDATGDPVFNHWVELIKIGRGETVELKNNTSVSPEKPLVITLPTEGKGKIKIFNWRGRLVYSSEFKNTTQWKGTNQAGAKLPAGIYIVLIEWEDKKSLQKVVVK